MIKAPGYVLKIKPYVPGKPVEELERELGITGSIKLASNENPLGPSGLALRAAEKCLPGVNRYPDGNGFYLKRKISEKLRVDEECIILGNGSNELLSIAARTFLNPGDEAIMAAPSFVVYPMATVLSGANPVEVPLRDWRHDLPAMARAITPRTRLLIIANPNNPTGTINSKEELRELMSSTPEDMLVVMDEAYYEYVTCPDYADSMEYLFQGKNILILRTFSKVYGLAGLRIGYGVSQPYIVEQMNRVREPFNTNAVAQAAAEAALEDTAHVERSVKLNNEGKSFFYREFTGLGMDYVPTEANFIFISVNDAAVLYEELLRLGVIIRPMGARAVRVTIGLPEENKRLIDALKKLKGKGIF